MLSTTQPHLQPHEEYFRDHSRGFIGGRPDRPQIQQLLPLRRWGLPLPWHVDVFTNWEGVRTLQFEFFRLHHTDRNYLLTQLPVPIHKDGGTNLRLLITAQSFQGQAPPQGSIKIYPTRRRDPVVTQFPGIQSSVQKQVKYQMLGQKLHPLPTPITHAVIWVLGTLCQHPRAETVFAIVPYSEQTLMEVFWLLQVALWLMWKAHACWMMMGTHKTSRTVFPSTKTCWPAGIQRKEK